jgi:hypothetical protein
MKASFHYLENTIDKVCSCDKKFCSAYKLINLNSEYNLIFLFSCYCLIPILTHERNKIIFWTLWRLVLCFNDHSYIAYVSV